MRLSWQRLFAAHEATRFTITEMLTALVVVVVIAAVAVPMWRTHELRIRRQDAIDALLAVQAAQDEYFGKHARYADEAQLRAQRAAGLGGQGAVRARLLPAHAAQQ